jgi:DNA-binding LytR/AlgR family response regulator
MLRVLAVDDEAPALEDLVHLLRADPRIGKVDGVTDATKALRFVHHALEIDEPLDALFLDLRMPGLNGLDLARVLARFADPPAIVFVTAYDNHAVEAFDLKAVDYLLKPVRPERLADAVDRVMKAVSTQVTVEAPRAVVEVLSPPADTGDETIPVELGGVVKFVRLADVRYVEAQGDYTRLHTAAGGFLVRTPISILERRWAESGFVRIHRSHLVAVKHIEELRVDAGQMTVRIGQTTLTVSRRHARQVRELLVRNARPGAEPVRRQQ